MRLNVIKLIIIDKLLDNNYSLFFLINRFIKSSNILKESYAEVIAISMKESNYLINEDIIDQIVSYISLDTLIYYGAESKNLLFSRKCVSEFWNRAHNIESKEELNNKMGKRRIFFKNIFNRKRKGDIK